MRFTSVVEAAYHQADAAIQTNQSQSDASLFHTPHCGLTHPNPPS
jgi:hypothetical protein